MKACEDFPPIIREDLSWMARWGVHDANCGAHPVPVGLTIAAEEAYDAAGGDP